MARCGHLISWPQRARSVYRMPYMYNSYYMPGAHPARGMVTVVNTHHEVWLDNRTAFSAGLPRLVAIWQQVSLFLAHKSENLLFEIFSESTLVLRLRSLSMPRPTERQTFIVWLMVVALAGFTLQMSHTS
jgi:hypothetical protein